jgi:hypothetical protein
MAQLVMDGKFHITRGSECGFGRGVGACEIEGNTWWQFVAVGDFGVELDA